MDVAHSLESARIALHRALDHAPTIELDPFQESVKALEARLIVRNWPAFWWRQSHPSLERTLHQHANHLLYSRRVVNFVLLSATREAG